MNKEFIPYELALKLKKLGFDEECFICKVIGKEHLTYTPSDYEDFPEQKEKEVLIPLYQQAFRFFREKFELSHNIHPITYNCYVVGVNNTTTIYDVGEFRTYEKAELACLEKLIKIVGSLK